MNSTVVINREKVSEPRSSTSDKHRLTTPRDVVPPSNAALSPFKTKIREEAGSELWYDSAALDQLKAFERDAILQRLPQGRYNGFLMYVKNLKKLSHLISPRLKPILHVETLEEWSQHNELISPDQVAGKRQVSAICSPDKDVLAKARVAGFKTALRTRVDDAKSLHASFHDGIDFDFLLVAFKDPTNIPLELVIAELHKTDTVLLKEINQDVDDAVIALGVLEMGSDGVLAAFTTMEQFDQFAQKMASQSSSKMAIEVGVIDRITHLGLGYRACIDTTHMFNPDEGILVGSTSTGGILCCPEVFHLPYMELRPFRINAAAVHSYIFQADERTSYISELRAGSVLTTVNAKGETRQVYVGRTKTEIRPLLLIEATFPQGRKVNIIMQDDWHVRVFSDQAKPLNVTELKPGDRVLGFGTEPGRHVGVKVDEHIIEL